LQHLPQSAMAKKRKGTAAVGNASKVARMDLDGGKKDTSCVAATVNPADFTAKSSLGVPFLVLSERDFVAGRRPPSREEWQGLQRTAATLVSFWVQRNAVVLADFEGEMPGIGGELCCAAFQRNLAIEPKGLRQLQSQGFCRDMGLLIDLRCVEGVGLVRQIMESPAITKMIWGADGDVASLRYGPPAAPFSISSAQVVDVQLAFSTPSRRLAMAKMLERLPSEAKPVDLPSKDAAIDFTRSHAFNRRALQLPLPTQVATYAMDDLHRLDLVLQHQRPSGNAGYMQALNVTDALHCVLFQKPVVYCSDQLRRWHVTLHKITGLGRQMKAVQIKRTMMALKRCVPADKIATQLAGTELAELQAIEADADKALAEVDVIIPDDLSLGAHEAQVTTAEAGAQGQVTGLALFD